MRWVKLTWLGILLSCLVACDTKKDNPISPSGASNGTSGNVAISAPKLLEPGQGADIDEGRQPITLLIENAASTGQRPLPYLFEVATDAEFNTKVFRREGVDAGSNGRTSVVVSDPLSGGKSYFWRARAADGVNIGPYSTSTGFRISTGILLNAPIPLAPISGLR